MRKSKTESSAASFSSSLTGDADGESDDDDLEGTRSLELDLVEAICLPVLEDAIITVRAALETNPNASPRAALPPFCRALLESRSAVDGWTFLMLAAGHGCLPLVDALLTLGELRALDCARCSNHGDSALHAAAASYSLPVCQV